MPAKQPSEWMPLWDELFANGDVDGILGLYQPGAIFVGEPGKPAKVSEALRDFLNASLARNGTMKLAGKGTVLNGDVATVYGPWTFDATTPDGPVHMEAVATAVLTKADDGSWRAVIDDFWSEG